MLNKTDSLEATARAARTWTYYHGNEYMAVDAGGLVSRPEIGMPASCQWKVTGAVRFNNFGHVVERATLSQILSGKLKGQWQYRNGKQQWHVADLDHGTHRVVMSPNHSIS